MWHNFFFDPLPSRYGDWAVVIHISPINKINFLSVIGNKLATQNSTSKLQSEAVIMGYHTSVKAVTDG
jgi:hypothetical protein